MRTALAIGVLLALGLLAVTVLVFWNGSGTVPPGGPDATSPVEDTESVEEQRFKELDDPAPGVTRDTSLPGDDGDLPGTPESEAPSTYPVRGRCVFEDGRALAGGHLLVQLHRVLEGRPDLQLVHVTTNDLGQFTGQWEPRPVLASSRGQERLFVTGTDPFGTKVSLSLTAAQTELTVHGSPPEDLGTLVFSAPEVALRGLVQSGGIPVPFAEVQVGGAVDWMGKTDPAGRFQVRAERVGEGVLKVMASSTEHGDGPLVEVPFGTPHLVLELVAPGSVQVPVLLPPELHARNVIVQSAASRQPGPDPIPRAHGWFAYPPDHKDPSPPAGQEVVYTCASMPAGEHELAVRIEGTRDSYAGGGVAPAWILPVVVRPGRTTVLPPVDLRSGYRETPIRVLDAKGRAIHVVTLSQPDATTLQEQIRSGSFTPNRSYPTLEWKPWTDAEWRARRVAESRGNYEEWNRQIPALVHCGLGTPVDLEVSARGHEPVLLEQVTTSLTVRLTSSRSLQIYSDTPAPAGHILLAELIPGRALMRSVPLGELAFDQGVPPPLTADSYWPDRVPLDDLGEEVQVSRDGTVAFRVSLTRLFPFEQEYVARIQVNGSNETRVLVEGPGPHVVRISIPQQALDRAVAAIEARDER